ncbi:MAG: proprotein convertase P-domain-containing protein [Bacteroidota bacterium]
MKTAKTLFIVLFIISTQGLFAQYLVGHKAITFTDASRSNRSIPCDVYYPADVAGENVVMAAGQFPLIVFGHGFIMADADLYTYLREAFAKQGYIFVFPTTEGGLPNHINFGLDLKFLNVQIKSENTSSSSFFYTKVASKSMIMGHSMGGKASYIASANNSDITTLVSLSAAMGEAPLSTAVYALRDYAPQVIVPTLVVDAEFDCVVKAADGHKLIYDTLTTSCKTYVNIKGGGHCYFASSDASNCETGEGSCTAFTITRAQQNQTVLDLVVPYANFMLKNDAAAEISYLNFLNTSTAIIKFRDCKANDLSIEQISAPVSICTLTNNENVTINIKNKGSLPQTNFQVAYKINSSAPIIETVNSTLASGASMDFTFTQKADLSNSGTYTLKTYTILSADEDHSNDTISNYSVINNNVAIPIIVDFNGYTGTNLSTVFSGWNEANTANHTGTTSTWLNKTGLGGASNITAKVNFTGSAINEWIISPSFKPTAYTKLTYDAAITTANNTTAYANGMSTNDQVKIMVSTDCGTTWTMLNAQSSTSGLTNTLTEKIVNLGTYAGQPIKIAFYATRSANATNNYDFHIDNINIKNFAPIDISPISLLSPTEVNNCRTNNETVTAKVHNYGVDNIDFSINPMIINLLVTDASSQNSANFSKTVNTGTLAAGAEIDVTITTAYNMTRSGSHIFTITSSTISDGNTSNDNLAPITLNASNPSVNITGNSSSCAGQNVVLTANATANGNTSDLVLSNNTQYPIPDNNTTGIQSPIIVTSSTALASQIISVTLDSVIHTYVGELKLTLIAPDGSSINLVANRGTSGDNFKGTVFIPSATNLISAITLNQAPYTGLFIPEQSFSALTGNAQGTWNLKAVDNGSGDVGTIKAWTLKLPKTNTINNYAWSTNESGAALSQINFNAPSTNSTYTVIVTDANGCSASNSSTLTITSTSNLELGTDKAICLGSSTIIDAGTGFNSYLWQNGTSAQTFTATSAGIVACTVTNACGSASDQINITVNPLPVVDLGYDQTICQGSSTTINAGAGFSNYSWSNGLATQEITVNAQGQYIVNVTNSNQCENADTINVVTKQLPSVTITSSDTSFCKGTPILFTGGGATSYEFFINTISQNISSTTNTLTNSSLQNGDVIKVNGTFDGCTGTSSNITVTVNTPIDVNLTENNGTLTSSAIFGNHWYNVNSGVINGQTNQSLTPTQSGLYYSVVTDINGCTINSDTINFVYVSTETISTKINTVVFPNPNDGRFTLNLATLEKTNTLELKNIQGQLIFSKTISVYSNYNELFDFSNLAKGIYYLKVSNRNDTSISKIIIE